MSTPAAVVADSGTRAVDDAVASDTERALTAEEMENELVDALLRRHGQTLDSDTLFGNDGLISSLVKGVIERALAAELSVHLLRERRSGRAPQRQLAQRHHPQEAADRARAIPPAGAA